MCQGEKGEKELGSIQNTFVQNFSDLYMLRSVSRLMRKFVKNFLHSPHLTYTLFFRHTKMRCKNEITHKIQNCPVSSFDLGVKQDPLSRKLISIAKQEACFYKMGKRWGEWANRKWNTKNSLLHAVEIAISSACNETAHYKLIHTMYTSAADTTKLKHYVYCTLPLLSQLNQTHGSTLFCDMAVLGDLK